MSDNNSRFIIVIPLNDNTTAAIDLSAIYKSIQSKKNTINIIKYGLHLLINKLNERDINTMKGREV
jgi:hypothetical protein